MKQLFFSFILFCLPTLLHSQNQVVINEIMFSPPEQSENSMHYDVFPNTAEWVEIYNPSMCNEVDVSCWVLGSDESSSPLSTDLNFGAFVFPQGTKIPPLGFIVVGGSTAVTKDFNSQTSQYFCGNSRWFLNNKSGWIGLYSNTGAVVNAVYWSTAGTSALTSSPEFQNAMSSQKSSLPCICSGSSLNTLPARNIPGIEFAGTSTDMPPMSVADEGWKRATDGSKTWVRESSTESTPKACNGPCAKPLSGLINGVNPVSCDAKGSASIVASDGVPPYTYSWSTGETTAAISNLASGNYSCTITDAGKCTVTKNVTIENKGSLTSTVTSQDEKCGLKNGSATIDAVGAVEYTWNTIPVQKTQTALGLSAGTYVGIVKDKNGCSSSATVVIKNSSTLVATISGSPAACKSASGSATVTVSAGDSPFTYTWNTVPVQNTDKVYQLIPGKYTCKVVDNSGCISNLEVDVTTINKTLTATAVSTNSICTAANGAIVLTPTLGDEPFVYAWSNAATTKDLLGLMPGTYGLTFSDKNGCVGTKEVKVGNVTDSLKITATVTDESCTNKNGQISTEIEGGTAPYSFTWNKINSTQQNLQQISAGVYTLIATDINGCIGKNSSTVANIVNIDVESEFVPDHCNSGIGSITLLPKNGQAPFKYLWNTKDTTKTLSGLHEGLYTAIVTDALGCQTSNKYSVENIVDKFNGYIIGKKNLEQDEKSTLSLELPLNWKSIFWIDIYGDTIVKPTLNVMVPYPQYGDFTVQATVVSDFGCVETKTAFIYVEPSSTFFVPNCITVNDDLTNDSFFPKYTGISEMQGWIFDRWGQKIYSFSDMYDKWNGRVNGDIVQQDIYVYRFVYKDLKGIKHERKGTLLVLKREK